VRGRTRVGQVIAIVVVVTLGSCNPMSSGSHFYVPPDCADSPLLTVSVVARSTPQPTSSQPTISTAMQLNIFDKLVTTVNQAYVYPDFNGIDWPAIAATYRGQIAEGVSTATFYADMGDLVTALGDKHSSFWTPLEASQLNASAEGDSVKVGSGMSDLPLPDQALLTVTSVVPGSPADHAGIKLHDSILAVNGRPIIQTGKRLRSLDHGALRRNSLLLRPVRLHAW
jgi:C-terminal processing protease CtpA/Prc